MLSTPGVFDFAPEIPWQETLVNDVLYNYDYSLGTHVALCSGSVGSGKSLPAAHLAVRHCLEFPGARVLLGRKALPDLKDTIFKKIVEHLQCQELKEGKDYRVVENTARIVFRNNSEIISRSWSDRKYKKLGSIEVSAAIIEEAAENDDEDKQAFEFIKMRVGRLPEVQKMVSPDGAKGGPWIILCSNPDEPSHWVYKQIIEKQNPTTHVYYSKLSENPFLPPSYEENLRENMDPLMARRMLDGEWISIIGKGVYHAYSDKNRIRSKYTVDPRYPVFISWDFNVAESKPLSVCVGQKVGDTFHFFGEVVVEGMRTEESCDELAERGFLNPDWRIQIFGDATGRHSDSRNRHSDWDIVRKFLSNYKAKGRALRYSFEVGRSNPPVRERHNTVNAYCCNAHGEIRLFVHDGAETVDEAFRLTKLKKGGQYIEDDGPLHPYQHIGTAAGYAIHRMVKKKAPPAPQFL